MAHYISFYFAIKLKHSLSFLSTAGDLFLWQLLNKDAGGLNILLISLFLLPKELYCRDSILNVKYLSWGENICDCKMGRGEIGLFVLCWKSNPLPLVPISLPADSITHQFPHFCPSTPLSPGPLPSWFCSHPPIPRALIPYSLPTRPIHNSWLQLRSLRENIP